MVLNPAGNDLDANNGYIPPMSLPNPRLLVMFPLGFSSGLPLALTSGTLQAWLAVSGADMTTIGLFSLVGLPYTVKFLWSPLLDRFAPRGLGRRRGWILAFQVLLLIGICAMAAAGTGLPLLTAGLALLVAFSSASQDVAIDAYRTDVLRAPERGLGAAVSVTGYRTAMLVSGALALVLADQMGFESTYFLMAGTLALAIPAAVFGPEPERSASPPRDLAEAVIGPLRDLITRKGALALLALVVLYKLGDAFAGTLTTAFLIRGAGFTPTDVGAVTKGFGLIATIGGAFIGGGIMARIGLFPSLLLFGILQAVSNLGFFALSLAGRNYPLMIASIGFENLSGGMGTASFVAFLMSLCNHRYSATQYALLSALAAVGRVFVGPPSGYLVEALGWPVFFLLTTLAALPGLALLVRMRDAVGKAGTPA